VQTSVLKTFKEVKKWFAFPFPIIAFDTETTSLDLLSLDLVGCSFCAPPFACYIDLYENPERADILRFLKDLFANKFTFLIGQNISYDLKVMWKYGIIPSEECKFFDTQVAAHLLDENSLKNLDFLSQKYLGQPMKSWKEVKEHGYHSAEFYQYGLTDAITTYEVMRWQYPLLKLNNLDTLFFDIEMPFQRVKVDLEVNGILIDREKLPKLQTELLSILTDLKIDMCKSAEIEYYQQTNLIGDEELITCFNFNSSPQLVKLIQDKLGLKITVMTEHDEPSVGKESLNKLKGQHPFIDLLQTHKKATKLNNSFVQPFPKFIDIDDRIRCNWHNTNAVTGRIIATKPNLLQLPRDKAELDIPFDFRSCFIAPEGKLIVSADYAGQELCWLGEVTGDENLIQAIIDKKDLHLITANIIFDLDIPDECLYTNHPDYPKYKEKYKDERYIGKNGVNFPLIYGMTAYGISRDFNISKEKAESWLEGFFSLYPKVKKRIAQCHVELKNTGQVVDWFGRVRRLESDDQNRANRQGFNFLVQSPSASQIKKSATLVRNLFESNPEWEAKFILVIYDELVYEVNETFARMSACKVLKVMENAIKTRVPFTVECGIGKSYGETK
jgi:DNA polymerase-1